MNSNFALSSQRSDSGNVGAQFPPEGSDVGDVRRRPSPVQGGLHGARPLSSANVHFDAKTLFCFSVACGVSSSCAKKNEFVIPPLQIQEVCVVLKKYDPAV